MANKLRFIRGTKEVYSSHKQEYVNDIYFSTDTQEIILSDKSYGVGIKDATFDPETNIATLTLTDGTSKQLDFSSAVVDSLDSDSTKKSLSAAQGKALKTLIDTKADSSNVYSKGEVDSKIEGITSSIASVYRFKGTVDDLPGLLSVESATKGDVYNVTNAFILNGGSYPAGTNVAYISDTPDQVDEQTNWDALGGVVDFSGLVAKTDIIGADAIDAGGAEKVASADALKSVKDLAAGKLGEIVAGDGISVSETNKVAVNVDVSSEAFLTVGEAGVKLSGVQDAIDAGVAQAKEYTDTQLSWIEAV